MATRMMFGPQKLDKKDSGWQRSPVNYAVKIIIGELFSKVKVSSLVETHYGCNPFAGSHNLNQQVFKSMYSGIREGEHPIIWRTIPSAQLKYKTPIKVNIPDCERTFKESELMTRQSIAEPNRKEMRPTHRDIFITVMKAETTRGVHTTKRHFEERWKARVADLGLEHEPNDCPDNFNVFHILDAKGELLYAKGDLLGGGKGINKKVMDELTGGLFTKLYPTASQKTQFGRSHLDIKEWPYYKNVFGADLDASVDKSDIFKIQPTDERYKRLLKIQKDECVKLSKAIEEEGWEVNRVMAASAGTFPLFIAARYGLWCREYSSLIENIHAVHMELVQKYQQEHATEEMKANILQQHSRFLGVFAVGKHESKEGGLKRPEPR
jgi:hypothetical protein